jgi:hypothetical protein
MWTLKDVLERPHLFPLLLYIILEHQMVAKQEKGLANSVVLMFPRKPAKPGGSLQRGVVFFVESQGAAAWLSLANPIATSCFPLATEESPEDAAACHASPSSFSSLPGRPSLLPRRPLSLSRETYSSPWPLTSAGVPCSPQPYRCAEKVRDAALFLLARRIKPGWPESPPPSRIPHQKSSSSAAKFVAAGHPLAKLSPPANSG